MILKAKEMSLKKKPVTHTKRLWQIKFYALAHPNLCVSAGYRTVRQEQPRLSGPHSISKPQTHTGSLRNSTKVPASDQELKIN